MCVEQVRKSGLAQQLPVHLVRMVSIQHPRPEADLPGLAPASATVAPEFQGLASSRSEFRSLHRGYLMARIEAEQMRHMPVLRICVLPVLVPFHQVARSTDLQRLEIVPVVFPTSPEIRIDPQFLAGLDQVGEQFPGYFQVHGGSDRDLPTPAVVVDECIFRRGRRGRNILSVFLHEPVHQEIRGTLHQRVSCLGEEMNISGEEVMLVQVGAEPWSGHGEIGPARAPGLFAYRIGRAPDVAVVVDGPAFHPVHRTDHLLSCD